MTNSGEKYNIYKHKFCWKMKVDFYFKKKNKNPIVLYIDKLSLGQGRREKKWNQLLENKKATDAPASFFFL